MEVKPDISSLRLRHGAIAGQSPDDAALSFGGHHQGDLNDDFLDYGVASSGDPLLFVSAALPANEDGDYPTISRNNSPGTPTALTDKKHMCAICSDRASGKHYGVHR